MTPEQELIVAEDTMLNKILEAQDQFLKQEEKFNKIEVKEE